MTEFEQKKIIEHSESMMKILEHVKPLTKLMAVDRIDTMTSHAIDRAGYEVRVVIRCFVPYGEIFKEE